MFFCGKRGLAINLDCAVEQVPINSTDIKSTILELHFRVRLADLRKQDMTQVQYKFHQITHVDFYGKIVGKPRNRWVCKSSLDCAGEKGGSWASLKWRVPMYVLIEQEDPGFGTVRTYLGVTWRYVCWRHLASLCVTLAASPGVTLARSVTSRVSVGMRSIWIFTTLVLALSRLKRKNEKFKESGPPTH